jgi:hypothetical protein
LLPDRTRSAPRRRDRHLPRRWPDVHARRAAAVPAKLFWSLSAYDARTRSEMRTDQNKAAVRSLFELDGIPTDQPVRLFLGPEKPTGDGAGAGSTRQWIQTRHVSVGSCTSTSTARTARPSTVTCSYQISCEPGDAAAMTAG